MLAGPVIATQSLSSLLSHLSSRAGPWQPRGNSACSTLPALSDNVPVAPKGAVVGLWFGFNGDVLRLSNSAAGTPSLSQGNCVGGGGSPPTPFGQFAYCNAPAFFAAAKQAIRKKKIRVPAIGVTSQGRVCPTTRDFSIVDQDPSDKSDNTREAGARASDPTLCGSLSLSPLRCLLRARSCRVVSAW